MKRSILLLLLTTPCYAGLITHTDYTAGNTITASLQNSNENTIVNEFNGNIDDNNIKSGAGVTLSKLATLTVNAVVTTDSGGHLTASSGTVQGSLTVQGVTLHQNNIQFSSSTLYGIVGSTVADRAASGNVGEISSGTFSGAAVPTSNQYGDPASVTLTAGDWDVTAQVYFQANTGTWSSYEIGISTNSGNTGTNLTLGDSDLAVTFGNTASIITQGSLTIAAYRMSLATTTTVYLKERVIYSLGTPTGYGRISARRVR